MEKIIVNNVDITKFVTSFEMYEEMDTDTIIGSTISTQVKLKLNNKDGQLTELLDYPFFIGNKTYIIYEKPSRWTQSISLVLYDQMILTNIPYETELPEKTTIEAQLEEMSQLVGIEIDKSTLSQDVLNRQVDWQDKTMVIRTYLGYIAQCDGKNAYVENDKIVFRVLCEDTHNIDFCSNYEINELIIITRVYYNNGTVIYSRGNKSNNTLYLDSNNRYVNESDVERIFSLYDHLSFYSFRNFKCRKTQDIKLTNLITYNGMTFMPISIKRKINGGEAKDSLELSGDIQIKNAEDVTVYANPNEEVKKMIVDQIDATRGEFERIDTEFIKVNQQLEANRADINILNASVAKIEEAYITKAEVEQLYVTKAEIGILNADVANIKTLLAGSTTTGDLQSIVINSKNAIIENGTIKNAMIESLAFDKITGVDINTTKMTVHSNDGKSTWKDNTIQISDSTRVRVQIGKDASNDYNIYIWDKTGKLMFDATGVTADGIQRPIIRDDMVSDTANINGKKINIQSVVKEINNGTEKIKSSTVLYDPTGQTLNIAFNELITTVDGIDDRVESNATQISVANGEISTLISKTTQQGNDINNLQSSYSSLNQSVNGLTATVGEHTSKITTVGNTANQALNAINGLEIGGRNILINSDFKQTTSSSGQTNKNPNLYALYWGGYNGGISNPTTSYHAHVDSDTFGYNVIEFNESDGTRNWKAITQSRNLNTKLSANNKYILSFDAYATGTGTKVFGGFYYMKQGGTTNGFHAGQYIVNNIEVDKWKRYSVAVPIGIDIDLTKTVHLIMYGFGFTTNSILYIKNVKLEIGNKATDWTPSPEDIESSITEVSDKQSSMQLDLDGFKTTVSSTYATKTQLNTVDGKFANYSTTTQMNTAINQSASNIKLEASKTYATKNELTGKVDTDKVVSAINVSPESIKIQSSKITLEGVVTANNYFKINTDGSMEAKAGKIAGFEISDTFIQNTAHTVGFGNDPGWAFWAGGATADTAKFRVTGAGSLYASAGQIAGFTIDSTYIQTADKSVGFGNSDYWTFWAGYDGVNTPNFIVNKNGAMTAKNANITGTINATNGNIAKFIIDGDYLKTSNSKVGFGDNKDWTFWAGYNTSSSKARFRIDDEGYLYFNYLEGTGSPEAWLGPGVDVLISGDYIGNDLNVGNTILSSSLEVRGNIKFKGTIRASVGGGISVGKGYFSGSVSVASLTNRSSEKLKTNIVRMEENALDIVNSSNIYKYNLKEDLKQNIVKTKYGFIIERETPNEIISYDMDGIDIYSALAINWKSTQEIYVIVSNLKNENSQLRQQVKNMQDKLDAFIQGNYEIREVVA